MVKTRDYALIKYKKRKGEKKAATPLLVEFKPGTKKAKARPYTQKKHLWGFPRNNSENTWLRRWFNNKY
jgi:hypothetical protein